LIKFNVIARTFATGLLAAGLAGCQTASKPPEKANLDATQVQQGREALHTMAQSALDQLYAHDPKARAAVEGAAGYGVFDVSSINVVLVVGARGKGVIIENETRKPTYMRAVRAGTGPGVGYQELYQVFVFKSREALEQFKLGGKAGGDVGASVSAGSTNEQISFNPYIAVYQVSRSGFAVQANWGGTAYFVDPDLN
jgi:lipid-binding SYLF domain-containing protein